MSACVGAVPGQTPAVRFSLILNKIFEIYELLLHFIGHERLPVSFIRIKSLMLLFLYLFDSKFIIHNK